MMKLYDGREELYQWDLGRKLIISDLTVDEIHFCNKTSDCSLVVEVYEEEGLHLADIPNILLQTDWPIHAYAYCGQCYTKESITIKVNKRSKPADYAYEETEVMTWQVINEKVDNAITGLEESEKARVVAEEGRAIAENNRAVAELAREEAEAKRASAEAERAGLFSQIEELKTKADATLQEAETALNSATTATNKANTATNNANTATLGANEATQKANEATANAITATANANTATANAITATENADKATTGAIEATEATKEALQSVGNVSNTFANALIGKASGEAVSIKDVSPVEHELGVKVSSKNLAKVIGYSATNPTNNPKYTLENPYGTTISTNEAGNSVTVTQNGFNSSVAENSSQNGYFFIDIEDIEIKKGEVGTVSFDIEIISRPAELVNKSFNMGLLAPAPAEGVTYSLPFPIAANETKKRVTRPIAEHRAGIYKCFQISISGCNCVVSNFQIEKGAVATAYTPYVDIEAVKVKAMGKNLCYKSSMDSASQEDLALSPSLTIYLTSTKYPYIANKVSSYTLSADVTVYPEDEAEIRFFDISVSYVEGGSSLGRIFISGDGNGDAAQYRDGKPRHYEVSVNVDASKTIKQINLAPLNAAGTHTKARKAENIQLEIGSFATEYEPYKEPVEYEVGTVEGIKSIYPSTTLTTDSTGALIECEYNRDINKAFAELQQAIISLGGNV